MKTQKHTRGQLSSLDFLLGITFISVFVLYTTPFIIAEDKTFTGERDGEILSARANQALDILVNYRGSPTNWTRDSFELPGIASNNAGEISERRMLELNASNYTAVKRSLGAEGIEFNFTVPSLGVYFPASDSEYAKLPAGQPKIFRAKRMATVNGTPVEIILYAW